MQILYSIIFMSLSGGLFALLNSASKNLTFESQWAERVIAFSLISFWLLVTAGLYYIFDINEITPSASPLTM